MRNHKDLPSGSQPWANEVDAAMAEIKRLTEVVKRLSENAGLDFSNPQRGVNTGASPSVQNPVGQKLSSLADTSTYNVLEGQVLTWSQPEQMWMPQTFSAGGAFAVPHDIAKFDSAMGYGNMTSPDNVPFSVFAYDTAGNATLTAGRQRRAAYGDSAYYRSIIALGNADPDSLDLNGWQDGLVMHDDRLVVLEARNPNATAPNEHSAYLYLEGSNTNFGYFEVNTTTIDNGEHTIYLDYAQWSLGQGQDTATQKGGGRVTGSARNAGTAFNYILIDCDVMRVPASGTRPAEITAPDTLNYWRGAHMFDTSIGIPIWFDGTNWVDATGTTV